MTHTTKWTVAAAVAGSLALFPGTGHAAEESQSFEFTASTETFTVPDGVCVLHVDAYGGEGSPDYSTTTRGGLGAGVHGVLPVKAGQTIEVTVGGAGARPTYPFGPHPGAFGGGGAGDAFSGPGGGATTVSGPGGDIIAGGGGGAGGSLYPETKDLSGGAGGQSGEDGHAGTDPGDAGGGGGGTTDSPGAGGTAGEGATPGVAGSPGDGRVGGDGGAQEHTGGSAASGGGGATGGGGGGAAALVNASGGGGGGGGSSIGPDGSEFSTGVQAGDGTASIGYDAESGEGCAEPEEPQQPENPNPAANQLPVTGHHVTPWLWLSGLLLGAAGAIGFAIRRRA